MITLASLKSKYTCIGMQQDVPVPPKPFSLIAEEELGIHISTVTKIIG